MVTTCFIKLDTQVKTLNALYKKARELHTEAKNARKYQLALSAYVNKHHSLSAEDKKELEKAELKARKYEAKLEYTVSELADAFGLEIFADGRQ